MSKKHIDQQHHPTFDGISHQDESGHEYWRARQLAKVLEYADRKAEAKAAAKQALEKGVKKPEDANRILSR